MSGVLEEILAELKKLNGKVDSLATGNNNGTNANLSTEPEDVAGEAPQADVTPSGVEGPELDKRGFPHDERIHAGTRSKNADGTWKVKPGIDRAVLIPQVEAELVSRGYGKTAEATPTAPGVAPTPAAIPGVAPTPPAAVNTGAPALPGLPPVPPAAPAKVEFPQATGNDDLDENAMVQTAAALMGVHGKDVLVNLLDKFGVAAGGSVADLDPDHRYNFWLYATNDDYLSQIGLI